MFYQFRATESVVADTWFRQPIFFFTKLTTDFGKDKVFKKKIS